MEPEDIPIRKVFSPFQSLWLKKLESEKYRLDIQKPNIRNCKWKILNESENIDAIISHKNHPFWTIDFGYSRLSKYYGRYSQNRDFPAIDGTTRLSPYIRFGIFSIRMIYEFFSEHPKIQSELIWREFWYHIAHHFPNTYHEEFQEKRKNMIWNTDITDEKYQKFIQ